MKPGLWFWTGWSLQLADAEAEPVRRMPWNGHARVCAQFFKPMKGKRFLACLPLGAGAVLNTFKALPI